MKISIVIPVFNESAGIVLFHKQHLIPSLEELSDKYKTEIIYINDGSTDDSLSLLTKIAKKDNCIKVVNLSRNFGKEIATTAGINVSSGDAVIILDSDGQHPPKLIQLFIDKWEKGAQVVVGVRNPSNDEGLIKKWGSKMFYGLFNSTSGSEIIPRSTDFRLIDKAVRTEFLRFTERNRITRGLIDWLGFKRDYVAFDAPPRLAGEASYKTSQLFRLAMNSFISLSLKPLFFFGWVGAFITTIALVAGIFIFIEQLLLRDPMLLHFSGSTILGVLMSFLVGLILISQSIIATYLSHVHAQTQERPLFVIDQTNSVNL